MSRKSIRDLEDEIAQIIELNRNDSWSPLKKLGYDFTTKIYYRPWADNRRLYENYRARVIQYIRWINGDVIINPDDIQENDRRVARNRRRESQRRDNYDFPEEKGRNDGILDKIKVFFNQVIHRFTQKKLPRGRDYKREPRKRKIAASDRRSIKGIKRSKTRYYSGKSDRKMRQSDSKEFRDSLRVDVRKEHTGLPHKRKSRDSKLLEDERD